MHVKVMPTLPRKQAAVISRIFARRTGAVKVHLADAADVVLGDIPTPGGHRVPSSDLNLHAGDADFVGTSA